MIEYRKLSEVCEKIIDCPHESPEWKESGIRVIRNFNLKDGQFDFSDSYYVDEETYNKRIKRAVPQAGDIIFSREAPIGNCAIIPNDLKCCLGQRLVLLRVNENICSSEYLLSVLYSNYVKKQIEQISKTGSIVSNFNISDLGNLMIPIIDNYLSISSYLNNIKELISCNNHINDNLHETAYEIYMNSFFKKKPNGHFEDILLENQKSPIQVREAKEKKGDYPFFTSGDAILEWDKPLCNGRNTFLNTGGNADVKFYDGEAAYSTDTWCITGKNNYSDYLYLLLYSIKPELNKKFFQGTGLKHLQKPLLKARKIYIPTNEELDHFNKKINHMLSMISENTRENKKLISLRDWLLPMLMNGQATIKD